MYQLTHGVFMKKFLATLVLGIASMTAYAEASFDQIQMLIQQQNYSAAEKGLEEIIRNHPKSAKAFYAMAQAQAGLGNQEKAKKALDIATGLNPTLDFAPQSSVASLKEAITPQVKKIESIEESHFWRDFVVGFILFAGVSGFVYVMYNRKKDQEEAERKATEAQVEAERVEALRQVKLREREEYEARETLRKQAEQTQAVQQTPPAKKKTKAELKKEADEQVRVEAEREARMQRLRAEAAEEEARITRMRYSAPAPTTTVVNNSSNDMLTGVLIGNMIGGSHHNHETTRVVEREVVREVPASRSSSWDDTPSTSSSSRSSSWDDTSSSSSSRSSSWDDDSSSRNSSSWSSSSSSDSSSSWSSSDSSSSSSSSSSWD